MTDIDDKLLEQQEQEQKEREMDPQFETGGNGHDKEEEDLSEIEQNREEILEKERRQAEQRQSGQ